MKVFKFLEMTKKARLEQQFLGRGPIGRNMPFCHCCQRSVEAANLEHGNSNSIEIKVRCHGKEDYCRIDFPYRLPENYLDTDNANWAIKRAMADYVAFDTSHTER